MRTDIGQVMLTFDDGLAEHSAAASLLEDNGLRGVFGVVTSKVSIEPGFLTWQKVLEMQDAGHTIANHTHTHPWSGQGTPKPWLLASSHDEIKEDILHADDELANRGIERGVLCLGTFTIAGSTLLDNLVENHWIRLTVGSPLPWYMGGWAHTGGKRIFPHRYKRGIWGISEAADARRPDGVVEKVNQAADVGAIAILLYHGISHVVGEMQNVTWQRFKDDISAISKLIEAKRLECVIPDSLTGGVRRADG